MRTKSLLAVAALTLGLAGPGRAQPPDPPKPPPEHPALEPAALVILKATSARLASARTLEFTAITTYESAARNGQPLYYATRSDVTMRRPNGLRVVTLGDGPASAFYYDGKQMIAYDPAAHLAAVSVAAPTIAAAMQEAYEKAAIYFPFAEVISPDPYENLAKGLTSAFVVGQSRLVGDGVTDMVALTTDRVQAEVWIDAKDGLPRMIRATYPNDPELLHYEIRFSNWRLNPPVAAADFTSAQALASPRMELARPDSQMAGIKP